MEVQICGEDQARRSGSFPKLREHQAWDELPPLLTGPTEGADSSVQTLFLKDVFQEFWCAGSTLSPQPVLSCAHCSAGGKDVPVSGDGS